MLTDFTIRNFRCFEELTLPKLARVNLFVGKNGVGKTTVLEAVELWAQRVSPNAIWQVLSRRREAEPQENIQRVLSSLFRSPQLPVRLGPERDERSFSSSSYSLPQGPRQDFESDFWTRPRGTPSVPSLFIPGRGLAADAVSKVWHNVVREVVDLAEPVRLVVPQAEDVVRGSEFFVRVAGRPTRVPVESIGDGAARMLQMTLALVSVRGGVLLIDEIENGIHYAAMTDVWRYLLKQAAAYDVQVFATTHSRDCLFSLAEASSADDHMVYRLERYADQLEAIAFDTSELDIVAGEQMEIR